MLHILLLILKIIGIFLAALLGIVALVLIGVLFVPVRYHIEAEGKLGNENPVHVGVKASWLLHIVSVAFAYPEAVCVRVKVFCFTLFDSSKLKKAEGNGKKKKAPPEEEGEKVGNGRDAKAGEPGEAGGAAESDGMKSQAAEEGRLTESGKTGAGQETREEGRKEQEEGQATQETGQETEEEGAEGKEAEEGEDEAEGQVTEREGDAELPEEGIFGKIKAFYLVLKRLFMQFITALKNIEYTIRGICDKINGIVKNIQYYVDILKSEVFRGAWAASKKQLIRILRMLRPRVFRMDLRIGMDNPAATGQILAIYGILYPFVGNNISVDGDFENKVMEGSLLIKGRIRAVVFLVAAFRLFINKNIRRLWKILKKEDM